MEEGKTKLFREKSVELVESPESLNDYLRVTTPGVWLVLSFVILLLIGVCIWGAFGHIDSTVHAAVVSQNGETVCLVPQNAVGAVLKDPVVKVEDTQFDLSPSALVPEAISEDTDIYIIIAGNLAAGDVVYRIPLTENLPEGIYSGTVVTEKLTPLSLLMN